MSKDSGAPPAWAIIAVAIFMVAAVCFLVARPMLGSPIPRQVPPKLTAEMLVGRWAYDWGQMQGGWIEFYPDGRYASRHDKHEELWYQPKHAGRYECRDGMLILTEGCIVEDYALVADRPYAIVVTLADWPDVRGECGTTAVKLSNQIRGKK